MPSENGWEPARARPDQCEWVSVPGANVTLQLLKGQPSIILRAFAADFHAHVEPLRDADSAGWTPSNKVWDSNHLNGTATDLNWDGPDGKTFRLGIPAERAYPGDKYPKLLELLDFYEDTVFCGGFWDIRDWMHFQLGGDTYGNPRTADFIARKIRTDGFSTFRRGAAPLTRAERYALAIIAEGRRLGIAPRGIKIALAVGLVETNLTMYANAKDPASMALPHDAVGYDYDSSGIYQQRPPWGPIADRMDVTRSTTIFFTVDKGPGVRGLTKIPYDYRDASRSPGFYAQKVQGSAFPDRYDQRFGEAERLYNKLAATTPIEPRDPVLELLMSDAKLESLSTYAKRGEGAIYTPAQMMQSMDRMLHRQDTKDDARDGNTEALQDMLSAAAGNGKFTDQRSVNRAKRDLAQVADESRAALRYLVLAAAAGDVVARDILTDIARTNRPALEAFIASQKG